jgi:hypothetical protein
MSSFKPSISDVYALISPDEFVGAGALLPRNGRFLLGIRPPKPACSRWILEVTAIGGALEASDGALSAGTLRECQEEIRCALRFAPCSETLVIYDETNTEWVRILGPERPAAVVFRHYRTPPRHPWHSDHQGRSCLVLFRARLDGQPRPTAELPALIWLDPGQILSAAHADRPLQALLDQGAPFVEMHPGLLPRSGLVRLTDSQEALVIALGADSIRFYQELISETT